jgi:hypothetical protein
MNILKSSNLKSMTSTKIKSFDGEDYSLWLPSCMYKNFMDNLSLKLMPLNLFVAIIVMFQGLANQNNTLLNNQIMHMCINCTT